MTLVQKILERFGRNLTTAAQKRLKDKGKDGGKLYKSLRFEVKAKKYSWEFNAYAEKYWEFVDRGVVGKGGVKQNGLKWKLKRTTDKTFKYRNKRPPTRVFNLWSIKKGIAPRSKGGQFTTRKSLLFALSESVYRTGLETTHFLTTPAKKLLKEIPNLVIKEFGLDIEKTLQKIL